MKTPPSITFLSHLSQNLQLHLLKLTRSCNERKNERQTNTVADIFWLPPMWKCTKTSFYFLRRRKKKNLEGLQKLLHLSMNVQLTGTHSLSISMFLEDAYANICVCISAHKNIYEMKWLQKWKGEMHVTLRRC